MTLLAALLATLAAPLAAQAPNRVTVAVDPAQRQTLAHERPAWANVANDRGAMAGGERLESMTLVLERSPGQEAALQALLKAQQDPGSGEFHHWLTPAEMGERFGLSDSDLGAIRGWLQAQNLHVNWIAPNRVFVGFGGAAADVDRAFQTEIHSYAVSGAMRYAANSDPSVPAAIAPAIKAIRGLSTPMERPQHRVAVMQRPAPELNGASGAHFIAPADFATLYDVPSTYTGAGATIGIVGWMAVDTNDLNEFRTLTGTNFPNPTVIVPTSYGGVNPGAACTTYPNSCQDLSGQEEATLDVLRAGSTAPGASLELVVSTASGTEDGIGADAQYLVNTMPLVSVMNISFGGCEIEDGGSSVQYWNQTFETAAGEGISSFVSSGDSGAAECDTPFAAPPSASQQKANNINDLCASGYATCVGGTEFNDSSDPSAYWSSTESSDYGSALSYIPEGGWNESTSSDVAASGGGVSGYIATPSWQSGTGVPSARSGRYTPDVAFSTASHDGYFACMESEDASCASGHDFLDFYGTSAAAPAMAGVAALLDQKLGGMQGNLNPGLYALAASAAGTTAFHAVTVTTSGVGTCTLSALSMCDNTVPAASGTQAGYVIGASQGYNEVTGLGSLDIGNFLDDYATSSVPAPVASTGAASSLTSSTATLNGTVNPNGADAHAWFQYGTSSTLSGAAQTAEQDIGSGTTATGVSANLSGLSASTVYYFQVVAENSTGASYGTINSLTTAAPPPTAVTGGASSVTASGATLNATSNPNGEETHAWFLYGTSSTLSGAAQTAEQDLGSGSVAVAASASLTGLSASTTYYFEAVAQNSSGASYGVINSFVTPATGITGTPAASSSAATAVQATAATLNGVVNPNGADTHVWFLYGTSSTLSGALQTAAEDLGAGTSAESISASLSGLSAGTDYYFQVAAQNAGGTTYGAILSFATPAATFSISGTSVTISAPGATSGDTSTISISSSGFSGNVTLSTTLLSSPSGADATYEPVFSFSPSSTVSLSTNGSQQVTVTVMTTAAGAAALHGPALPWYGEGGAALACLVLLGIPARRRHWWQRLGVVALLAVLAGGMTACGGSSSGVAPAATVAGTTPGAYTFMVTGTSGATVVSSSPITVNVE